MSRALQNSRGWLLIAALFYAPWAYGGNPAWSVRGLDWILAAVGVVWLGDVFLRGWKGVYKSCNRTTGLLIGLILVSLLFGWGMTLNAHSICDTDYFIFMPLSAPVPAAPGSVDYTLSLAWMTRATCLLGCLLAAKELAHDERWLLRIWWAIGLAGGSIALLGLLQKATGAGMIFWQAPIGPPIKTFFATYYYHANAGAYLNLVLPPIAGLAYRYATRPANPAVRALWLTTLVIVLVAVASNTSRMAQLVAALMLATLLLFSSRTLLRRAARMELKTAVIAIVVVSAALWAVVQASHLDQPLARWAQTEGTVERDARWLVAGAALHALPSAGALGFGPGTFSVTFPYFTGDLGRRAQGIWIFLHDDYLQTAMEWGWLGATLWGTLFFGGMLLAFRNLTNRKKARLWYPRQRNFLWLILLSLGGIAVHAAVDFPLQISSLEFYVAVYLGICWGSGDWDEGQVQRLK